MKQQLGLGEPKSQTQNQAQTQPQTGGGGNAPAQGSTQQADKFKADFQAAIAPVNECLQYTAAHAEQDKHNAHAAKRDKTCSAYQVALARINPTNPAAAQGAIDQVIAAVQSLASAVQGFKDAVQKAFDAWTARDGDLEQVGGKIREMVEWGHEKAAALQQIVDAIGGKANARKYEEALQALEQLIAKIGPIYDEYLRQKAAQGEYNAALPALEPRLGEAATCEFKSLESESTEIASAADQMRQAADAKNYVSALEQLHAIEGRVANHLTRRDELREKKAAYEQARAALDPRLAQASSSQYKALADLDQEIASLTTRVDEAATAEEFDQALQGVQELTAKVDEKDRRITEIEQAKAEYEQAKAALDPKLQDASSKQYKALGEFDQQIADLTGRMDEAAAAEDYEQALATVNELSTKVDEKLLRAEEIERAKTEYEQARAALDPRLQEAATCEYPALAECDQPITDLTARLEEAVAAEEYEQALSLVNELSAKVDEKLQRVKEIEEQKAAYEAALAALQPRLGEASVCKETTAYAEPIQAQMVDLQTQMEAAAKDQDYETALQLLEQLTAKVEEFFAAIEAKKQEYEAARKAAMAKFEQCHYLANSYSKLDADRAKLKTKLDAVEADASKQDYEKAKQGCDELATACDAYLAEGKKLQADYEKKGADITKQLDEADDVNREEVARKIAGGLDADVVKHMPIEVRNRITQEIAKGGFSDDDKKAMDNIYKVRTLDPAFEEADRLKRQELIEKLKSDPEFAKARENWSKMTKQERLDTISKAANIHADVYDTKDVKPKLSVKEEYKDVKKNAKGEVIGWNNGVYDHRTGEIGINTNSYQYKNEKGEFDGVKFNDFDKSIDLAVHESGHRYQYALIEKLNNGDIKKGDPLYNQAMAFKLNDPLVGDKKAYYARDGASYYNQPMEAHSRESAGEVQQSGVGTHHGHDHDH